ncbi:MAG: LacI family DNA-binding transcriptional regulator [Planctomycetota bacterium]
MTTLGEIAEMAGVSKGTVSNVLNGRNREIWPGTIARAEHIRSIAAHMGYRPNGAARAIRRGSFESVALITAAEGSTRSMLSRRVLDAIHDELIERNCRLTFARCSDRQLVHEADLPKTLRELHSDGVLLNYNKTVPQPLVELLHRFNVPSIWINAKMGSDCVFLGDREAGRLAARQLLAAGHCRIGYLTATYPEPHAGESAHYSEIDRRDGCVDEVVAVGFTPRVLDRSDLGGEHFNELHMDLLRKLLRRDDRPTGFVCYGLTAANLLAFACLQVGIDFPRELSAVVVHSGSARHCLEYSTVSANETELGRRAIDLLFQKIETPDRQLEPVCIPPLETIRGETVFPPQAR